MINYHCRRWVKIVTVFVCLTTSTNLLPMDMASQTGRKILVGRRSVLMAYQSLNRIMINTGLLKKVQFSFFWRKMIHMHMYAHAYTRTRYGGSAGGMSSWMLMFNRFRVVRTPHTQSSFLRWNSSKTDTIGHGTGAKYFVVRCSLLG